MNSFVSLSQKSFVLYGFFGILALILTLPSLHIGLQYDDIYHRLIMLGLLEDSVKTYDASLFGLFSFLDGNPERSLLLMDKGVLPWWTLPEIKYTFFRPLSEISIWLDYQLWPHNISLMHFHHGLWYVAVILSTVFFFSKLYQEKTHLWLPITFITLSGINGITISWLSARNAFIALVFAMLSAYFFSRFITSEKIKWHLLALLMLLLSLSAGEVGISTLGILIAFSFAYYDKSLVGKVLVVIPAFLLTLGWLALRSYLDFGAYGSDSYLDPFSDTKLFLENVLKNINLVWLALGSGVPVEYGVQYNFNTDLRLVLLAFALNVFFLLVFLPFWVKEKRVHFYLWAMLFSTIPVLAGQPQTRVLLFPGIFVCALIADCLVLAFVKRKETFNKNALHVIWLALLVPFSTLLLISHLVIAPFILVKTQPILAQSMETLVYEPMETLELPEDIGEKKLILVNPPIATVIGHLPEMLRLEGKDIPDSTWLLSSGKFGVHVQRTAENKLVLTPNGGFLREPSERIMRSQRLALEVGEEIHLKGMSAKVLSTTEEGFPLSVEFTFDDNLEADKYLFLSWKYEDGRGSFEEYKLPDIGVDNQLGNALF